MSKVAVIYWSGTGNTEAMAGAVAEGAKAAGAEAALLTCADVTGVSDYDAVALGCPAMGAEELEDSEFLPMLEGIEPALPGKKVALFGSYGWGRRRMDAHLGSALRGKGHHPGRGQRAGQRSPG